MTPARKAEIVTYLDTCVIGNPLARQMVDELLAALDFAELLVGALEERAKGAEARHSPGRSVQVELIRSHPDEDGELFERQEVET